MERGFDVGDVKVVYGIDRRYLVPAVVSIHSLCEHATVPLEIIVYGDGIEPSDHETLWKVGETCGAAIDVRQFIPPPGVEDFRNNRRVRWPAISLLPLQLPWLVRGRCLFIDADTLVMRDVSELMAVDMEGMPLAAAMDTGVDTSWTLRTPKGRLTRIGAKEILRYSHYRRRRQSLLRRLLHMGMRPGDMYFNSGVLVTDCDAIRDLPPPRRSPPLRDLAGLAPYLEHLPDQDRLNEFFAGRCARLHVAWNLKPLARDGDWPSVAQEELKEALENPGIWHYMGRKKPWSRKLGTRLSRRYNAHPAFRAWRETYMAIRDVYGLERPLNF